MNHRFIQYCFFSFVLSIVILSCNVERSEGMRNNEDDMHSETQYSARKNMIIDSLPTIGLLMYDGVLQSEVVASSDVFAKLSQEGKRLFNVITVAETKAPITTEEGLRFIPDFTIENCPELDVLFVPSAYDMTAQVKNKNIINFIREKNVETQYVVSNCAGAQLIGESGIADGHRIVTWIGGGKQLQKDYPSLIVQNDSLVTYVHDGKFFSSNGNLASYISALNLLEEMTSEEHRLFVEDYLYLNRLKHWGKNKIVAE